MSNQEAGLSAVAGPRIRGPPGSSAFLKLCGNQLLSEAAVVGLVLERTEPDVSGGLEASITCWCPT